MMKHISFLHHGQVSLNVQKGSDYACLEVYQAAGIWGDNATRCTDVISFSDLGQWHNVGNLLRCHLAAIGNILWLLCKMAQTISIETLIYKKVTK